MPVRIGVDVGGTFTKAVACDSATGEIECRAIVQTTHASSHGVADGVVQVLDLLTSQIEERGIGPVLLVAHSTTQAVNALLEGDTSVVGVLGMGRPPDLRKARKRTHIGDIKLAPGRTLKTLDAFVNSPGSRDAVAKAIDDLTRRGAESLCASEAFGVDDPTGERLALELAGDLPACAGHELSGLYGLELRTITAAINASILPVALRTATTVERAVAGRIPGADLLVMRGDGGAADIATMRRRPLLTAFSGPAASVVGALRHLSLSDAVVVEVGGTSTNVSVVKGGRPVASYIRVLEHVTSVRSLDVRVLGVAGGSMLRTHARRFGGTRLAGIGPRSAHIAGLDYCAFARADDLVDAKAILVAPRPGDPAEYVEIETNDGRRLALTLTCAANALGRVPQDAYARGEREAARAGFSALGRLLHRDGLELAEEALRSAATSAAGVVTQLVSEHDLERPAIVGLGGGAGALIGELARILDLEAHIPPDAEVISSVGDALSLVRIELERAAGRATPQTIAGLVSDAEDAALAAGADPDTLHVETESVPERNVLRAVALGAAAPDDGSDVKDLGTEGLREQALHVLGDDAVHIADTPGYCVFGRPSHGLTRFAVLDRRGAVVARGDGHVITGTGDEVARDLRPKLTELTRHLGPFAVAPSVRIVRGRRLIDLSLLSSPGHAVQAAMDECEIADGHQVVALVTES